MFKLLYIGLIGWAATTASYAAHTGQLKQMTLPDQIRDALYFNHEIGRGEWNNYSIHRIRYYHLAKPEKVTLNKILEKIVLNSKKNSESALIGMKSTVCGSKGINRVSECVELIRDRYQVNSGSLLKTLNSWRSVNQSRLGGNTFSNALEVIESFVRKKSGENYYEYEIPTSTGNLNNIVTIVIRRDLSSVIVTSRNVGV